MPTSVWTLAKQVYGDHGLKAVCVLGCKKIVHPFVKFGSMYFLDRDLSTKMPSLKAVEGIVTREGTLADLDLLDTVENPDRAKNEAAERLTIGDRWVIAVEEATGKLANYRWISMSSAYVPELSCDLIVRPGQAYLYNLETLPEFRRRGIEVLTRQYTYTMLYRRCGIQHVVAYIRADNYASLKAARRYLTPIARVWYVRFRGKVRIFMRPNERMPELRASSDSSSLQAAVLTRTSRSLR